MSFRGQGTSHQGTASWMQRLPLAAVLLPSTSILDLGFHLREKALPIPLVLAHGLLALTGLGLLLFTLYGRA